MKRNIAVSLMAAVAAVIPLTIQTKASVADPTGGAGYLDSANGVFFSTTDQQPVGTALVASIVRVQTRPTEQDHSKVSEFPLEDKKPQTFQNSIHLFSVTPTFGTFFPVIGLMVAVLSTRVLGRRRALQLARNRS